MKQKESLLGKLTPREFFSDRDSYRNRQILLNKVTNYWLKGVLEKSLDNKPLLQLDLTERLDAIASPSKVAWETLAACRHPLPPGTEVIDIFAQQGPGRSLLILGEPGSGKTITLLQLAGHLVEAAQGDYNHPIPVIFNLSSWQEKKQTLANWLAEELHLQYHIRPPIAATWVQGQQLLPLLDGLDEVPEEFRNSCVEAINQFTREWGQTEIVVCSRVRDYEMLYSRLRLQKAIYLEPLTPEGVQAYLTAADRSTVATLLAEDKALQEFVSTPLMLQIITLAAEGISPQDIHGRKHLFNAYIERMLSRRDSKTTYSVSQTLYWLKQLAASMSYSQEKVLFIERMQPSRLLLNPNDSFKLPWQKRRKTKTPAYKLYTLGVQTINGLTWGGIVALIFILGGNVNIGVFSLLAAGLLSASITKTDPIKPVQSLKWSWSSVKGWLPLGLLFGASGLVTAGPSWGVVLLLSSVFMSGLLTSESETSSFPNEGIWESAQNATFFGSVGAILCSIGGAGLEGAIPLPYLVSSTLLSGGIVGLILALVKGGKACIQHFVLRLLLWSNGDIPWNYSHFLNYAVERNLLQRVGGGYIFIHRLLQEHFQVWGRPEEEKLLEFQPTNADGYLLRGNARVSLGDPSGAIEDYNEVIRLDPDLAEAYGARSLVRYLLGDNLGVLSDYQQTYHLDSRLAESLSYTEREESNQGAIVKQDNPNYIVTVLNDDVNSFDYVYRCLMKYIPGMKSESAWHLTWKVHKEGQAVVWLGEESLAQLYRTQLSNAGLSLDVCWPQIQGNRE